MENVLLVTPIMTLMLASCWIIFVVYWLASAGSVKPIQKTTRWLGVQILVLVGFVFIINPIGIARINPTAFRIIPFLLPVNLVAVILAIAGLIVAILARRTLAGNWSRGVVIKEEHELISTGLYGYVRHPIYSAVLLMTLGTALSFGTLSACIGLLIIVFAFVLKLRAEEMILTGHFSDEYLAYKSRTKALIPFVW
jgi:protein-S-isoprenylcysteine O-methyltransferase Ste14